MNCLDCGFVPCMCELTRKPNGKVTISKARHQQLLEAEIFLLALRAGGVETWDGYRKAMLALREKAEAAMARKGRP